MYSSNSMIAVLIGAKYFEVQTTDSTAVAASARKLPNACYHRLVTITIVSTLHYDVSYQHSYYEYYYNTDFAHMEGAFGQVSNPILLPLYRTINSSLPPRRTKTRRHIPESQSPREARHPILHQV